MNTLKVKKLKAEAVLPSYGSEFAAGADLYACIDNALEIPPHTTVMIGTGIAMEIPEGYGGFIYARSGISCKRGLAPANKVGVVDSDYRGEITVALHNHGDTVQTVEKQERIAQIVIAPFLKVDYIEAEELEETARGEGGFGSTGK